MEKREKRKLTKEYIRATQKQPEGRGRLVGELDLIRIGYN